MKIRLIAVAFSLLEMLLGLVSGVFLLYLVAGELISNTSIIIDLLHIPLNELTMVMVGVSGVVILVCLEEYREKIFGKKKFWWWLRGDKAIEVQLSPLDKTLTELAITSYSELKLLAIANYHGTIQDMDQLFPIECIRQEKGSFHVWFLGTCGVAELVFDRTGKREFGALHRIGLTRMGFIELQIGQSLEEVKRIDPEGEYCFTENTDNAPKKSYHYIQDGYKISIDYDEENIICDIIEKQL